MKAGHAQPFRPGKGLAGGGLHIFPVGAGAGVQQHADHGQVDAGAGAFGGVRATGLFVQLLVQQGLAVHTARLKVAPAAVVRNAQVAVPLARDGHHFQRGASRALSSTVNQADLPGAGAGQQGGGAFAYGGGGAQAGGGFAQWRGSSCVQPPALGAFQFCQRRARRRR
jgi:hypothetical protein